MMNDEGSSPLDLDDMENIADEIDGLIDRINQTIMNLSIEYTSDDPTLQKLSEAKMYLMEAEDKVRFLL